MTAAIGIVTIGRNEGERLERCLRSIADYSGQAVYVDSGSVDGSAQRARALGFAVVELDTSAPFTAARARNAGFKRLIEQHPNLQLVQFVDGDCELQAGWIATAANHLEGHPKVAVVCGHRREQHRQASRYRRLADIEWATALAGTDSCGGDAMMRVDPFRRVGGFRASMIAFEEPDLCQRLRREGYEVVRLDCAMTLHDAGIERFGQWWRRCVRFGYGSAQWVHLQGRRAEARWIRRLASNLWWGGLLPGVSLVAAWPTSGMSFLLLGAYAPLWMRIYRRSRIDPRIAGDAALYASACTLLKLPAFQGALRFACERLIRRRNAGAIEYK